jgi:nucleotide-binding universal stress UspA family protein
VAGAIGVCLHSPWDLAGQAFARSLGAVWTGGSDETPPEPLDAAIIFARVGDLVPLALTAVRKGGRVVCAGIHISDVPGFPYRLLWEERQLVSVANLTRQDGLDFLSLAPRIGIVTRTTPYPLAQANEALTDLRAGRFATSRTASHPRSRAFAASAIPPGHALHGDDAVPAPENREPSGRLLATRAGMAAIAHILFPFDFSAQGAQTVPFVKALAHRLDARITLYSVMPPAFDSAPAGLGQRVGDNPAEWQRELQSRLDHALVSEFAGMAVDRVADCGDPARRAVMFAESHGVNLIMMPTHGLGLFRNMLVGSVTSKVLHDAKCPVWTAAHTETQPIGDVPKTILCAIDGTPGTPALLQWAAGFSKDCGATLQLLHVVTPITDMTMLESERARQDQFRNQEHTRVDTIRRDAGIDAPLRVAVGEIVPTVAEEARREGADLIVIGRGLLSEPFGRLRTHAFGIIQRAPCPVLSV